MAQCLIAHVIAAILVVSGALLVIIVPMHSYHRLIKHSPFASRSQPADFADNLRSDLFREMCRHDCTKYRLIFAKTCADLQNVQVQNRTDSLMLLYGSDEDCRPPATASSGKG